MNGVDTFVYQQFDNPHHSACHDNKYKDQKAGKKDGADLSKNVFMKG
jgi:hypothetical protein